MMFLLTCLCLLVPLISARSAPSKMFVVDPMPAPDGNLNIYKLPSGQGGAHIIQCPDGDLSIYDLGANDEGDPRFMQGEQFQQFLGTQNDRVQNVILSHHHLDHYSMLANTFPTAASIPGLQNIFISCTLDTAAADVITWVNQIGAGSLVRTFNNGGRCGPHPTGYTACSDIPLCPNTPAVRGQVLAANMGQHCTDGGNKNVDSIYLKVSYGTFSTHLQGDFEDETTSTSENGPYQYLIDYYGAGLLTTVYTFSHHGATSQSNKPNIRAATQPKALWSDGNPWYSYNHPRCLLFDEFANTTQSVCKPAVTDTSSPFYCGVHIDPNVPAAAKLQSTYTCGFSTSATIERETRYNNEWAFYTTIPDEFTINIIKLSTDGDLWGFTTNVFATP